ncbi:rhamnulose-1-phosphate aldolase [Bacillus sp. 1P06AnD]|uniref:rhamnulose-1-phosphate aldolase n=1 Tax=Bacillus sp. 1P06AnD TaxID=3132208 RepID=UPI0039A26159
MAIVMEKEMLLNAPFVNEMMETTFNMWKLGWDERNGGNISFLLKEEEVLPYIDPLNVLRTIELECPVTELANRYFIVTGSGKYFKNVKSNPESNLGIIRVASNGMAIDVLWGFSNGGRPTSELSSHFLSHISRLNLDKKHRVIMHAHATNIIAMTFSHELDEKSFTKTLWKMCTECLVVFPDGIGVLPWMVPGTEDIGNATADKMKDCHLVIWPFHGIFGAGNSIDEAFGLIETVEKAAQVYTAVCAQGGMKQCLTDAQLKDLASAFGVVPKEGYLAD